MKEALRLLLKRVAFFVLAFVAVSVLTVIGYQVEQVQEAHADADVGVALPVVMYHSVLKDPQRAGKFVVSPRVFEQDLQYLKDEGYTAVLVEDLIAYVNRQADLPEKPVLITLDDGYYNNLTYVLPILERLDMKAVISVVGEYTVRFSEAKDLNPNYAHLSWDDINVLRQSGRIEIQNHSYGLHTDQNGRKGSMRKSGESLEAYRKVFLEDTQKLQELLQENCGFRPAAYVYPYGAISDESTGFLKEMGFAASFTCYEKINYITRDNNSLFRLGRFNRPSNLTTAEFMEKILTD